jgi:MerR family transcriptional regulator, thiopeptide resistance regulator
MDEPFDHNVQEEARRRWGHTPAYRESTSRVAGYTEADWQAIRAEADQIARDFAELLRLGEHASGERARALAERHRRHISQWFYPCSPEMPGAVTHMRPAVGLR